MNNNTTITAEITQEFPLNNVSTDIVIGGDSTVFNDVDEVGRSNSGDQSFHEEQTFYLKLNCYKARLKFSEKAMLSLQYYQKIVFAMKQSKSGKHNGVDSKFFGWCKKHFKLDNTIGNEILVSLKDGRRIIFIESYWVDAKVSADFFSFLCFKFLLKQNTINQQRIYHCYL